MICSNCGASISSIDEFCPTCNFRIVEATLYKLILPISTDNEKIIKLTATITDSDYNSAKILLSRPGAVIMGNLLLSKAVGINRQFQKLGYKLNLELDETNQRTPKDPVLVNSENPKKVKKKLSLLNLLILSTLMLIIGIVASVGLNTKNDISKNMEAFFEKNTDPAKLLKEGKKGLYRKSLYENKEIEFNEKKFNNFLDKKDTSSYKNQFNDSQAAHDSMNSNISSLDNFKDSNMKNNFDASFVSDDVLTKSIDNIKQISREKKDLIIHSKTSNLKNLIIEMCSKIVQGDVNTTDISNIVFIYEGEKHVISLAKCLEGSSIYKENYKNFELFILKNLN
ncbi:MAG: hypothetical protein JXR48_06200 [Candidatus Delongbacteria bacterium]|nr:hypothetical protein [Candidatus Delongbacteria bacterium]MBN2834541.1 hypothetical protein [Candidatus Delongbacteria bacterium]